MITRIREVRRAKGMTLDDVAKACDPPTTPQTVGRLETGTRTVSVGWLNRIAAALGVDAAELVTGGNSSELKVVAILGANGHANAPRKATLVVPPKPAPGLVGLTVAVSVGDYRAGDEIWCEPIEPENYGRALNRDIIVPRPAGRFLAAGPEVDAGMPSPPIARSCNSRAGLNLLMAVPFAAPAAH